MKLQQFLNWGWDEQQTPPYQMRRVRTLTAASLILILVALFFFVRAWLWWIPLRVSLIGAAIVCGGVALVAVRWRRYSTGVHLVALGIYIGGLNQCVTLGGMESGAVAWWLIVPLMSGLMLGARAGLGWLLVCLCSVLGAQVLEARGVVFPNMTPDEFHFSQSLMITLAQFIALGVIMIAYLAQIEIFERRLEQRNQELVQQVQRAEAAEQAALVAVATKTRFLANMSHELRTPLNAILGFTQRILRQLQGQVDERQYSALQMVEQNGEQMLQLMTDLLDLSRLDAGRLELSRGLIDLREMVNLLVPRHRPTAERFHLQLEVTALSPAFMEGDISKLQRALESVLLHALQYAPTGKVQIQASLTAESIWSFEVHCDQLQFSEEQTRRLFDPTDHLHSASGRAVIVSGLALLLARELVQMHGGNLELNSQPGAGTRYQIRLPIH